MSKIKREFDLTTESGHCNAMDFLTSDPSLIPSDPIDYFLKLGMFSSIDKYKTREPYGRSNEDTAKALIIEGKKQGVKRMLITVENSDAMNFGVGFEDVKIETSYSSNGKKQLVVEYKDMTFKVVALVLLLIIICLFVVFYFVKR